MTTQRIPRYSAIAATVAAAAAFAVPATANAATTAALDGTTLTVTGDAASRRSRSATTAPACSPQLRRYHLHRLRRGQTVPADGTIDLEFNAGGGDDAVTITTALLKSVTSTAVTATTHHRQRPTPTRWPAAPATTA